jgi:predicted transcriptional regulator
MSYYEDRIKALEARIEEMSMLNRMKAIPVEAKLMDRIGELNKENARLKAEVERLTKHNQTLIKELENTDCMFAMASAFARDWNAAKGVQS